MGLDKQNVLIPGAGGAAGIGAIKSLRMCKFQGKIVSTDVDILSAGLYLAEKGYVVPPANDPLFLQEAMKIIEKELDFKTFFFKVSPVWALMFKVNKIKDINKNTVKNRILKGKVDTGIYECNQGCDREEKEIYYWWVLSTDKILANSFTLLGLGSDFNVQRIYDD